ncbi:MAG: hypothetical protein AABY22_08930 [Nanoarchaeota archaeon]
MKKEEKSKQKENTKLKIKLESIEKENKKVNQAEESINFRKLSLEEIIPVLKENNENTNITLRETNIKKEEEKQKETPIYDINKVIEKTGYHSIADYQSSEGNYDMFQKAGTTTPTMINPSQQNTINENQTRTYENFREKERKRKMW